MSRVQHIVFASGLLLIAALALITTVSQVSVSGYSGPDDNGVAHQRFSVFEPAVIGTVVTALASLSLLVHLLVVARRAGSRWMWVAAVVVSIIAVGAAVIVSMASRPVF